MDFLLSNWETITTLLLVVLGTVFGVKWKDKIKHIREFIEAIEMALEDDRITKQEALKIVKEFKDIL